MPTLMVTLTPAAYSTTEPGNYSGFNGQVLVVHSDVSVSGDIQNIITWRNTFNTLAVAAPEPSTFAIAGLGTISFAAYELGVPQAFLTEAATSDRGVNERADGILIPNRPSLSRL